MALRKTALKKPAPSLAAIKQAAWELGVLLVEQADFSANGSGAGKVQLIPTQPQLTSATAAELLSYAIQGAGSFIISTEYPGQRGTMPFFSNISYRGSEQGVFAEFNDLVYEELSQLQRGIRVLQQQNALTVANLTSLMKDYTPHVTFNMVVKCLPEASITILVDKL